MVPLARRNYAILQTKNSHEEKHSPNVTNKRIQSPQIFRILGLTNIILRKQKGKRKNNVVCT